VAILSALFDNNVANFQEAFGVQDTTSPEMTAVIQECFDLYFGDNDREFEDDCQRLPVIIVNKIAKTMFAEYEAAYKASTKKSFCVDVLEELNAVKRQTVQYMLMGGECLLKPVIENEKITFMPIRRDCFIPLGRDTKGRITAVGTAEFSTYDEYFFTLLEKRSVEDGKLIIESKLFYSREAHTLGVNVPLATLERYAGLEPRIELPINNVGLIYLKTPILNDVDGSNDGVAIFEPARKLIHNINRNEKQLSDEFDLLQARIVVSADMLKTINSNGEKTLVDKVFTGLDDNPEDVGIHPFSPAFREMSYLNRKTEYLRNIESLIGLKRGLLANVQEEDKTATEITDSKGEYNLTIIDFQTVWTEAVKEACVLAGELGKIYNVSGAEEIDPSQISCDYGDGVLYNRDKAWAELLTMVQIGLLKPELALAWYYELPHETDADLEAIRKQYMPEMEQLIQEGAGEQESEEGAGFNDNEGGESIEDEEIEEETEEVEQ